MGIFTISVCVVSVGGSCVRVEFNMSESDFEGVWFTQESNVIEIKPNFDIGYIEEDIFDRNKVISLEEDAGPSDGAVVLYDNVIAENISSDECVVSM